MESPVFVAITTGVIWLLRPVELFIVSWLEEIMFAIILAVVLVVVKVSVVIVVILLLFVFIFSPTNHPEKVGHTSEEPISGIGRGSRSATQLPSADHSLMHSTSYTVPSNLKLV